MQSSPASIVPFSQAEPLTSEQGPYKSAEVVRDESTSEQKQNHMLLRELALLHSTPELKLIIVPRFFFFVNNISGARIKYQHGGKDRYVQDKLEALQSSPVNCVFEEPKVRRFVCPYENCTYSTIRNSDLKVHIRTHTGEKPYKCTFPGCSYASITKSILTTHMRTHTGEKPLKCPYPNCHYCSASHSNLKVHIRTHTREKAFRCSFPNCSYACSTSNDLNRHMQSHIEDKAFHCDVPGCSFACISQNELVKHKKKHIA